MTSYLSQYVQGSLNAISPIVQIEAEFLQAAQAMGDALRAEGTVFFVGNGGSASDAQHLAAELVGRFVLNRPPLKSICLNTDTSILTALANDFGYETVFQRQLQALGRRGDVIVLISTSGESGSILAACEEARSRGITSIGLTGPQASSLAQTCDIPLAVGSHPTCHIQEAHITIGQALCGFIEQEFFA